MARFTIAFVIGVALALSAAGAAAGAEPPSRFATNCQTARYVPQTTICQTPDLLKKDMRVARDYAKLRFAFGGAKGVAFRAGQEAWARERNGCRNSPTDVDYTTYMHDVTECLEERLGRRLATLDALAADRSSFEATVADYDFIDPWYLNTFATAYAGRSIEVFGTVKLNGCGETETGELHGRLSGTGEVAVEVKVGSNTANVICFRPVYSWWSGTVRLEKGRAVLTLAEER